MSAENRLVEYFLVAGVDSSASSTSSSKGKENENRNSSASLPPPTSPLAAAINEREDGKSCLI